VNAASPVALVGNVTLDICVDVDFADVARGAQSDTTVSFLPGGGLPNVGQSMEELGTRVLPIGAVGHDQIGRLVNDLLPWPVTMVSGQRTEISVIGTVGERTILNQQGTAYLSPQDVTDLLPDNAVVVFAYLNCCCVRPKELRAVVEMARERGATLIGALNGVFSDERRAAVLGVLDELDVLVMNQQEASWLAGGADLQGALHFLADSVCPAVITLGARGLIHLRDGRQTQLAAEPVMNPRTLGAGDAFLAGMVTARLSGHGSEDACGLGQRAAAAWVAGVGTGLL
jgi:sugar/nucleoside kinase (ribokinase family)